MAIIDNQSVLSGMTELVSAEKGILPEAIAFSESPAAQRLDFDIG